MSRIISSLSLVFVLFSLVGCGDSKPLPTVDQKQQDLDYFVKAPAGTIIVQIDKAMETSDVIAIKTTDSGVNPPNALIFVGGTDTVRDITPAFFDGMKQIILPDAQGAYRLKLARHAFRQASLPIPEALLSGKEYSIKTK